jgi:8-oxo-dGTP pyrophosphatase MutT (NUDIX family)
MSSPLDLAALRERLSGAPGAETAPPGVIPAAVLVPIVAGPAGWYLLFTRRTETLSAHGGELAFPGGRMEVGDSAPTAALREAWEELGIDPAAVELLGALPPVNTRVSRYLIFPSVGVLEAGAASRLVPNPAEVDAVIEVPLEALAAPEARRDQRFIRGRHLLVSPAYDAGGVRIWGATARIVSDLLERIAAPGDRPPIR